MVINNMSGSFAGKGFVIELCHNPCKNFFGLFFFFGKPCNFCFEIHQLVHRNIKGGIGGNNGNRTGQIKGIPNRYIRSGSQFLEEHTTGFEGIFILGGNVNGCLFGRSNVHFGSAVTGGTNGIHNPFKFCGIGGKIQFFTIQRPIGLHNGFPCVGQGLPNFFGNERHKGMEKFQGVGHYVHKHCLGFCLFGGIFTVQANLYQFNVPVAKHVPNKVVQFGNGNPKLEFFQVFGNFFHHVIETG